MTTDFTAIARWIVARDFANEAHRDLNELQLGIHSNAQFARCRKACEDAKAATDAAEWLLPQEFIDDLRDAFEIADAA